MNTVNYAQTTNIMAGSPVFKLSPFYLQSINIPGISFSHPEVGGRNGVRLTLNADSIQFGDLSFTVIVDEDFLVYDEIVEIVKSQLDFTTGNFTQNVFDFWITVTDSVGHDVMKWNFFNAKIESIGDMQYDYSSEETQFTLDISLKYDNFNYQNYKKPSTIPSLRI